LVRLSFFMPRSRPIRKAWRHRSLRDKSRLDPVKSVAKAATMSSKFHVVLSTLVLTMCWAVAPGQPARRRQSPPAISENVLLNVIRHEDERRWDDELKSLLANKDAEVRKRAALAAGRIGDGRAVPDLADMLLTDRDTAVRDMAAFALGEIESPGAAYALVTVLKDTEKPARARAIEALGKVTAAMVTASAPTNPGADKQADDERLDQCKAGIVEALQFEAERKPRGDQLTILLGLTAMLRTKPDGAGSMVAKFLNDEEPSIVATALNTMARLRLKDAHERVRQLLNHNDPIVRANAARVIGAAEDKEALEAVLDRALHDQDLRVRVSSIRTLASLKDARAVEPLLARGSALLNQFHDSQNELLEIATLLGRLLPNKSNPDAVAFMRKMHDLTNGEAVEVEVAFARIVPGIFQNSYKSETTSLAATWRQISRRAQGLAAIKDVITGAATGSAGDNALKDAQRELADMLQRPNTPALAIPDVLQAYGSYKMADTAQLARKYLLSNDVIVRATAAEVIGNQTPGETDTRALIDALPRALRDKDANDAALAILDALAKQKSTAANEAIKTALSSSDHLIRRRSVTVLKANGAGDFSDRIGTVQTKNTIPDYRRAIARIGQHPTATVVTNRGSFTIEFIPDDAPLTVDNFIQLAKRGYFNGQTIPRVVPNFVVQAGDPRGDQNGGPGHQIRCEINEVPYERAAVGMALSGKDTGGSQWFVTLSPQPHLDGGYTVFGRVIRGMEVVDNIARGDTIQRVVIDER
jgi:cyclophilin family peptidyl-prolyl cis-trans isomerase/HEAT repeat protein